jgi:hypothetical protein
MQEIIIESQKKPAGIEVFWQEKETKKRDFFSYRELIDQKINAIDLLEHPGLYLIDGENHRIVATEKGCCTYT